jgi:hypothetical protein
MSEFNKKSINYDVSSYDCIIVEDEIFLYTTTKKFNCYCYNHN